MMLWLACMTVSLLLWGRQATFAQPMVVPAALEVYSDAAAPRCGVSYLVLRAAMDASCEQQCQLTLAETHTPSTALHSAEDAVRRSASPESQLLSNNVISLPRSVKSQAPYLLQALCYTGSNCRANPSSWDIIQTPSRLHITPLYDQEDPVYNVQQEAVSTGCIYELNATVIKTTPLRSAEDDVFDTAGSSLLNTWSTRIAVLLCLIILQQIASRL